MNKKPQRAFLQASKTSLKTLWYCYLEVQFVHYLGIGGHPPLLLLSDVMEDHRLVCKKC